MKSSRRQAWLAAALLFGAAYFLIGRLFTLPAENVLTWRVAAWLVSGVAYATHIAYEHFRLRNSPRLIALHVSMAVALGAVGLALAGMIHSLSTTSGIRPSWLLALLIWPAVTAVPAFFGALVAEALLARFPGDDRAR